MLKGRLKFIVAIAVIFLTVSYLVYAGVKDTMVYYLTVEELKEKGPSVYDDRVRVSGIVVPGTIVNKTGELLRFTISDGSETVDVTYGGIIPDVFRDDVEAVVEGVYTEDNIFVADTLLAKCPTKYESTDSLYDEVSQEGYQNKEDSPY